VIQKFLKKIIDRAKKQEREECLAICKKIVDDNDAIEAWNWSAKRAINAIEAKNK
jgi:hypothetical protein